MAACNCDCLKYHESKHVAFIAIIIDTQFQQTINRKVAEYLSNKIKFILDSIAVKPLPKKYTPIIIDERGLVFSFDILKLKKFFSFS